VRYLRAPFEKLLCGHLAALRLNGKVWHGYRTMPAAAAIEGAHDPPAARNREDPAIHAADSGRADGLLGVDALPGRTHLGC
jgi:hypothetical protein